MHLQDRKKKNKPPVSTPPSPPLNHSLLPASFPHPPVLK